jgi:MFS family permease
MAPLESPSEKKCYDMTTSDDSLTDSNKNNPYLKAAIRDGVSFSVMMGAGETYIGPFGIFLKATTLQVGLLATLPQLFGAIMQFLGARAMPRFRSRRKIIFSGVMFQALVWIPMALMFFFLGKGSSSVYFLIGLVILYRGANGIVNPIWSSLIGDIVPPEIRGRYFGHRNRLTGMASFISLLLAGLILSLFEKQHAVEIGYLTIFLVAFLARADSARWIAKYSDPELVILPEEMFTFRQFLRRSPHSNFAKFVFFFGAINLAVTFSGPYFSLYMLRDLHFSYLQFTAVTAAATITQFFTFGYWGQLSDRFGNKKILNICGWGVTIVPLLWLISSHIGVLMLIQVYAGLVWAGFNLASGNFLFDAVTPPKRALCVAYQGLINGMCIFIGSMAGGYLGTHLPASFTLGPWSWHPVSSLQAVFLISGVMRLTASALLLNKFKEVRPVEPLIFRISQIRPIAGATFHPFTGYVKKYKNNLNMKNGNNKKKP